MAMSFSRPDPSSPTAVSAATFPTSRKGFEQAEVRDFLRMVAAELARLQEREKFLERELRAMQRGNTNANIALDEEVVTRMLGEEAARILSTAREAASQIKIRAEENASRVLREATDEAQRLREEAEIEASRRRQDASADAEAELSMAKQQGRDMVNEARAYRERVLGELARRREMARQQIEQLVHGRDRLLQAFERARIAAVDVMAEMTPLGEPNEYVNLAPTTGPVPIMVPARDLRPATPPPAVKEPAATEPTEPTEAVETVEDEITEEPTVAEITDDVDEGDAEVADDAVVADAEVEPDAELVEDGEPAMDEMVDDTNRVVALDIEPAADVEDADDADEHGTIAPVVALFAGEVDLPISRTAVVATQDTSDDDDHDDNDDNDSDTTAMPAGAGKGTVDDLFAKLRASRANGVVERAQAATDMAMLKDTAVLEIVEVTTLQALSLIHI